MKCSSFCWRSAGSTVWGSRLYHMITGKAVTHPVFTRPVSAGQTALTAASDYSLLLYVSAQVLQENQPSSLCRRLFSFARGHSFKYTAQLRAKLDNALGYLSPWEEDAEAHLDLTRTSATSVQLSSICCSYLISYFGWVFLRLVNSLAPKHLTARWRVFTILCVQVNHRVCWPATSALW